MRSIDQGQAMDGGDGNQFRSRGTYHAHYREDAEYPRSRPGLSPARRNSKQIDQQAGCEEYSFSTKPRGAQREYDDTQARRSGGEGKKLRLNLAQRCGNPAEQ